MSFSFLTSARMRSLALSAGAGPVLRGVRRRFPSASVRRDRLDNAALRTLLAAHLDTDSNCVDVGANIGGVTERIVELAPDGQHYSFEPLPQLAAELRARYPQIHVVECALSDRSGTRDFTFVKSRPGYSGFRERSYPAREELEILQVKVERLDDVLPADYAPALIKIDVEGAELEVLRGGLETIRRFKPLVVFEHGLGAADYYDTSPEEIFELFAAAEMRIFDLDGGGPYTREQLSRSFAEAARWNYFARP
jgi:FkbM family methyltransferase